MTPCRRKAARGSEARSPGAAAIRPAWRSPPLRRLRQPGLQKHGLHDNVRASACRSLRGADDGSRDNLRCKETSDRIDHCTPGRQRSPAPAPQPAAAVLRTHARARQTHRACGRPPDPRAQQGQLSVRALADLDLGVLHRAWPAHVRPVRSTGSIREWRCGSGRCSSGTGIAGLRGRLPGVEPRPYIIRFTEDRPNPLYRRVCYTLAWSEVIAFALLNVDRARRWQL